MQIMELGFIDKGTGKHQSNTVYGAEGIAPTLCAGLGIKYWTLIVEEVKQNRRNNAVRKCIPNKDAQ